MDTQETNIYHPTKFYGSGSKDKNFDFLKNFSKCQISKFSPTATRSVQDSDLKLQQIVKIIEKMVCVKFHTKIMIFDRVRVKKRAKFGSRPYMGIRFSSITQSFFAQFQQNCIWILRRPISIILQSFMGLAQKIKISIRARVCRDCRRQKVPIDFKLSQIAIQSIIYLCDDFQ